VKGHAIRRRRRDYKNKRRRRRSWTGTDSLCQHLTRVQGDASAYRTHPLVLQRKPLLTMWTESLLGRLSKPFSSKHMSRSGRECEEAAIYITHGFSFETEGT